MKAIAYDSHTIPEIWDIIHVDLRNRFYIYFQWSTLISRNKIHIYKLQW